MIIQIFKYSASLQTLLSKPTTCEIHSIFDSTINVRCQHKLIALSHKTAPLTPMSINLDCSASAFEALNIKKEDDVFLDDNGLFLNNQRLFDFVNQAIDLSYPVYQKEIDDEELILLKANIDALLLSTSSKGLLLNCWRTLFYNYPKESSFLQSYLYDSLVDIKQESNLRKQARKISNLIGAGEGLTPSGDDFICGILAIFTYLSHDEKISERKELVSKQVKKNAHKTTDVSKEYLLYASDGLFNEYVSKCFNEHTHNQPYLQYLHKISTLGHSSGTDFLVGMYFGLEIGGIL